MIRVSAKGYWRMVGRFGKRMYFGRVIVDGQEKRLRKTCKTASEAVAYGNRVVARYQRLAAVGEV